MNEMKETDILIPDKLPPLAELEKKDQSTSKGLRRGGLLLLAVSAQVLALMGFAHNYAQTYAMGQTVKLKATLYDPRDPFKGEYVQLSFPDLQNRKEIDKFSDHQTAYIVLKRGDTVWSVDRVVDAPPTVKADEAFIKTEVSAPSVYYKTFNLGFDKFFVPEGKGSSIDGSKELTLELAVDDQGRGLAKHILMDGKQLF